jgi:uncharacterized protein YbdZ (MbtH family)
MTKDATANWNMDADLFQVLVNDEGHHLLWLSSKPIPAGRQQVVARRGRRFGPREREH